MKQLEIEWRHLDQDGKTCDRCSDTGENVRRAIQSLADDLEALQWRVTFKETRLTEADIAESNQILLNGIPLDELLPNARISENCCASCGELLGAPTLCRTLEYQERTHEAIPVSLIREAAYQRIHQQNR